MSGFLSAGIVGGPDIPDADLYRDYDTVDLDLSDGQEVTSWNGLSSNSGSPTYRTDGPNGNPYVEFDSGDSLSESFPSDQNDFEIFIAGRWRATNSNSFDYFYIDDNGFDYRFYGDDSATPVSVARGVESVSGPQIDTNWHVYNIEHTDNGAYLIDNASNGTANLSGTASGFQLGRDASGASFEVGRVLIYSAIKNESDSTVIHDALSGDYV